MRYLKKYFVTIIAFLLMVIPVLVYSAGSQQASSLTGQNVIDRAREYLKEATASFYTDAQMLIWVNNGIMDIATKTGCMEFKEEVTLSSGTLEYTLSANFIGIYAAYYSDGTNFKGLEPGRIQDIGKISTTTIPKMFYEADGKVGFDPVGSASDTNSVFVLGYERPTAIALGGTVPLPAIYDPLVTYYVVAQGLYKKGKLTEGKVFMDMYNAGIEANKINYVIPLHVKEEAK